MLLSYKVASFAVFLVFLWFVFDIRQKPNMVPLIRQLWTTVMKVLSIAVMGFYCYLVAISESLRLHHVAALVLTALGAGLVATAKLTLGRQHTWAGYHLTKTKLVSYGVYSYIRHPLYTGVFLFEFGGLALIVGEHTPTGAPVDLAIAVAFAYLMAFNIVTAGKESQNLEKQFGDEYRQYRARVRAFLPIRRRPEGPTGMNMANS